MSKKKKPSVDKVAAALERQREHLARLEQLRRKTRILEGRVLLEALQAESYRDVMGEDEITTMLAHLPLTLNGDLNLVALGIMCDQWMWERRSLALSQESTS